MMNIKIYNVLLLPLISIFMLDRLTVEANEQPKFAGPCNKYFEKADKIQEFKCTLLCKDQYNPDGVELDFENGQTIETIKDSGRSRVWNKTQDLYVYTFTFNIPSLDNNKNGTVFQCKFFDDKWNISQKYTIYFSDIPLKDRNITTDPEEGCEVPVPATLPQNTTSEVVPYENQNQDVKIFAIVIGSIISLCIVLIAIGMYIKEMRKPRPKLSSEEIRIFKEGEDDKNDEVLSQEDSFANRLIKMVLPFTKLSYLKEYEIAEKNLRIAKKKALGEGQFGIVFKGRLKRTKDNTFQDVACKTIKAKPGKINEFRRDFGLFLREIKILQRIGHHENVVRYIGSVTKNIENCDVYLVVEYCSMGNLLEYVKSNATKFQRDILGEGATNTNNHYVTYGQEPGVTNINNDNDTRVYIRNQLLIWTIDIALGMEYLSSQSFIHCDLAARNILLSETAHGITAKISDFGLSKRALRNDSSSNEFYYRICLETELMPALWTAPEVMQSGKVTEKSDVWSFGVTMWEIFSLGMDPYIGEGQTTVPRRLLELLLDEVRLDQPPCATSEQYDIMEDCWNIDAQRRPRFLDLIQTLSTLGTDEAT